VVRARRNELELLFRNLIDNAVKYGASPPAVAVSLRLRPPDRAEIVVADNGRGIPRHLRRKVFGRFVRLGSELERDRPGTGLGLYIVRTIVRRLRGKVSIRDRGDQPGTAFEVQLPARANGELGS
jgi:signal transduction histidine kinase